MSLRTDPSLSWFHRICKNWPSMAILNSDLLHGTVHHPTKFQAALSLRPGLNLSWKILKFRGTCKNRLSIAILNSELLHGIMHHPDKFQADIWNPYSSQGLLSQMDNMASGCKHQFHRVKKGQMHNDDFYVDSICATWSEQSKNPDLMTLAISRLHIVSLKNFGCEWFWTFLTRWHYWK